MTASTVSLFCGGGGESVGKHLALEELGIPSRAPFRELRPIEGAPDYVIAADGRVFGIREVTPRGEVPTVAIEINGARRRVRGDLLAADAFGTRRPADSLTPIGRQLAEWFGVGLDEMAEHIDRFWSNVRKADGGACWEWQGFRQTRKGKPSYGLFCIGRKNRILAHRFAWMLEHGPIPDELVIRHDCDNVACVRENPHLLLGTQADNMRDMWSRDRGVPRSFPTGVEHHGAAMDPDRVFALRIRRAAGATFVELGAEFGIHPSTAFDIATFKTWKEVA